MLRLSCCHNLFSGCPCHCNVWLGDIMSFMFMQYNINASGKCLVTRVMLHIKGYLSLHSLMNNYPVADILHFSSTDREGNHTVK